MAKNEAPAVIEFVPFGAKDKIQLSIEIVKRLVAVPTRSGRTCSDDDALKFILMCQARKLNPFEGDAFLLGYDNKDKPDSPKFSLITAHQAFLKRAEVNDQYDGMESGTIVERKGEIVDLVGDWHMPGDKVLGGWAVVYFKNRSKPMRKRLRLQRFQKQYGIWQDDPAGMIVKCAEADALRSSFPTMLGGLYIQEEFEQRTIEVAAPVIPEMTTTGNEQKKIEEKAPEAKPAAEKPQQQPEKKEPTLKRKSAARSTENEQQQQAEPKVESKREKFTAMLATIKMKPEQFIRLGLTDNWLEAHENNFDAISDARFDEFMQPENFAYVSSQFEKARAAAKQPASADNGRLL